VRPAITAFRGEVQLARVECPAQIAPRDWLLGVVAVQCEGAEARVRANLTGWPDAVVVPLESGEVVDVVFGTVAARPANLVPAQPGLFVFLDGDEVARAPFGPGRAFGHVFCRYLKSGAEEAGFDLTPFLDQAPGTKYERLVSQPLAPGQVVSYAYRGPPTG